MDEHTSGEPRDRAAATEAPDGTTSPVSANVAIPVNAEVAANVLSGDVQVGPSTPQGGERSE